MGEEVRNMPDPMSGRQEKSVLALGRSSVSSDLIKKSLTIVVGIVIRQ